MKNIKMMKRDLPLTILKSLEQLVKFKPNAFTLVDAGEFIFKAIDKESETGYYFNIERYGRDKNGQLAVLMDRKPKSDEDSKSYRTGIAADDLEKQFKYWLNLLDKYKEVSTSFEDPILKSFEEEYYNEFEITPEDAKKPLKPKQILLIDEHLTFIESNIEKHQITDPDGQINGIMKDVVALRENLTSNSKDWVIRQLSKIWAKLTKQGIHFMKEFVLEGKRRILKEGTRQLIEYKEGPSA